MNKRIRKKMHKKYVYDVVSDISTYDPIRQLMRKTEPYERIKLNVADTKIFTSYVTSPCVKYGLNYNLYRTECDDSEMPMCLFFVEARDYPNINGASLNCLELDYNE